MRGVLKYRGKLKCRFCGNIQDVVIYKAGGKDSVSDQVSCDECNNYISHGSEVK